jgi:hypothetical protein
MIRQAMAGSPPVIRFENIDGKTYSVPFSLGELAKLESLIAASAIVPSVAPGLQKRSLFDTGGLQAKADCGLVGERRLEHIRKRLDEIRETEWNLAWASVMTGLIPALVACTAGLVAGPPGVRRCGIAADSDLDERTRMDHGGRLDTRNRRESSPEK